MDNYKVEKKDILDRTLNFSVSIIKLVNSFPKTPVGYAIGNQIVRSGTSVGANLEEAQDAFSRKDFSHAMNIALKEARETKYWLEILKRADIIPELEMNSVYHENVELIRILTVIVKKTRQ